MKTIRRYFVALAAALIEWLRQEPKQSHDHAVVLRLTLVLLLLYGSTSRVGDVPVYALCGLMLAFPAALFSLAIWWALVAVLALLIASDWFSLDNHKYLLGYWSLCCALSLTSPRPTHWLGESARYLVAMVFSLAVVWKVAGGQYHDGSFFYFTFVVDRRLQAVAAGITGMPVSDLWAVSDALTYLGANGIAGYDIYAPVWPWLDKTSRAASVMTIVVEASVAMLHWSTARRQYAARHYALMTFIIGTYFLLPVFAFGYILTLMGLAQCGESDSSMKLRYIIVLGIMHLTLLPWWSMLLNTS